MPWQGFERVGKKAREKRERKKPGSTAKVKLPSLPKSGDPVDWEKLGSGDLNLVEAHVKNYLKGVREAETALMILGRDASAQVMEIAEQTGNAELLEFGKKLVAVKPKIETNMQELRRDSIVELMERELPKAKKLADSPQIFVNGSAVAVFDPLRVADAICRGGRPRSDVNRISQGDLLWVSSGEGEEKTKVVLAEGDGGAGKALELRLQVDSGLVYVGPPEASDGPRLGTVRFHPFKTGFDDFVGKGRFVSVAPGRYAVRIRREGGEVRIFLAPAPNDAPLTLSMSMLALDSA